MGDDLLGHFLLLTVIWHRTDLLVVDAFYTDSGLQN